MGQALSVRQPSSRLPPYKHREATNINARTNLPAPSNSNNITKFSGKGHLDTNFVIAQTTANRVDSIKSLTVNIASQCRFVISEMLRSRPGHGATEPQPKAESYAACVHLSDLDDCDVWCDNRILSSRRISARTVHISDMRHEWQADIRSPFHVVNFYMPQAVLDGIADEHDATRIDELNCPISSAHVDTVLKNLTLAILPALVRPEQANKLFADYAARAVIVHLARTYGSLRVKGQCGSGGLVPWQERRAKEMLLADLSGDLNLPDLAGACRLSASHFSHAFRQTVGCPPHQWLLAQRVERAKQLILNTRQPLSEIALETGFADQSHFTRVFTQRVKASPAAWRRAQER
jgi:AraC family transcriptional regulator